MKPLSVFCHSSELDLFLFLLIDGSNLLGFRVVSALVTRLQDLCLLITP